MDIAALSQWWRRIAIGVVLAMTLVGLPAQLVQADPVAFGTILTQAMPIEAAVTPDGSRLYVTNNGSGSVSVFDTQTNAAVGEPIPVGSWPRGLAVTPDGSRVYVANYGAGSVSVIDTSTNATVGTPITVGGSPWGVAVTPDGRRVYVTNVSGTVSVIDTSTNQVVSGITLGVVTHGVAVSPDGSRVYVTRFGDGSLSVIDTNTNATVGDPIPVGALPEGIAITPGGKHAYVANHGSDSVSVIDTETNSPIGTPIAVGDWPWGIAVSPDGDQVIVANNQSASGSVIDTDTKTTVGSPIAVGAAPMGVAFRPDGSRAYVVSSGHYLVTVIAVQPSPPTDVTAVAGNGEITASWQPPTFTGDQPITDYLATASPGGQQCTTGGATTCAFPGLTNGAAYTVTVTATNSIGTSMPSKPSTAVTPTAPVMPPPPNTAPTPGRVKGVKARVRHGKVRITWRSVAGITVYRARISKPGAVSYKAWKTTTKRVFRAKLRTGKAYRFQVRALGAGGRGPVTTLRFRARER